MSCKSSVTSVLSFLCIYISVVVDIQAESRCSGSEDILSNLRKNRWVYVLRSIHHSASSLNETLSQAAEAGCSSLLERVSFHCCALLINWFSSTV